MKFEKFVGDMMRMNSMARLMHWGTKNAQHHVTYEKFLTANIEFTDSFVESLMGNNHEFNVNEIDYSVGLESKYDLDVSKKMITDFRSEVAQMQETLEKEKFSGANELVTILDDVVELSSKTLYLLKLS